ncbi:hypothetical protein Tco_0370135 [Tanacetum coccineum]
MDKPLRSIVPLSNTVKELWDELQECYGVGNAPKMYQLKCTCKAPKEHAQEKEDEKLMQFLLGLNDNFGIVCLTILNMEPFPMVNKAYSLITREGSHKTVIRNHDDQRETIAMAAHMTNNHDGKRENHGFVGYPSDYRVTLGFGSIEGGLDRVNPVIRLPLEHGISRVFDLEIDQLADEYELGIGKKGHMLDKIWEYCKDVHKDNTYWWHDHRFEKEECDEMGIEIEKYDPPEVQVETFKVRKYSFKGGQKFVCVTKEVDDALPLKRRNGSRFKEMIWKEFDINT